MIKHNSTGTSGMEGDKTYSDVFQFLKLETKYEINT